MKYVRPQVQTVSADAIVDSMGPVSCGSGVQTSPGGLAGGSQRSAAGPLDLAR